MFSRWRDPERTRWRLAYLLHPTFSGNLIYTSSEVAKAVAKRVVENEAKASKPKLLVNVKEITAAFRQWKKENPDAVVTNPYGGSADEPDVDQDADDSDD